MSVVVVTDSGTGLDLQTAADAGVQVVPLHVLLGTESYREGIDEIPEPPRGEAYTTSGASTGELAEAYRQALTGADGVVAVHLSGRLSGTWNAGRQAAEQFDGAVRVVDSGAAGMATGLAALAAAQTARAGAGLDAVHAAATAAVERIFTYVYLHRVDDLRRSGRIGAATSFLSTALSTRTLLRLGGGELQLREKARIPSKALSRLVDSVIDELGERRARIAVQHHHAPDRAEGLAETLTERLGDRLVEVTVGDFGPVMGLHLGRGAAGVAVLPDEDDGSVETDPASASGLTAGKDAAGDD